MLFFAKKRTEDQLKQFIRASTEVQEDVVLLETFRDTLRNEGFGDGSVRRVMALALEIHGKLGDIRKVLESVILGNTGAKVYDRFETWGETTRRMALFTELVSECTMFLEGRRPSEVTLMNKLENILVKEKQEEARVAKKIGAYQKLVRSTATVATGIALLVGAGTAVMPKAGYASEVQASVPTGSLFRQLGWDVYDDPGLKNMTKRLQYKIQREKFTEALQNNEFGLNSIFNDSESRGLFKLTNGAQSDDELNLVFVTKDDYLAFSIKSSNGKVGLNGTYIVMKKLNASMAENFRKLSPDYYK